MKRIWIAVICLAFTAAALAGASIVGADEPTSEPPATESEPAVPEEGEEPEGEEPEGEEPETALRDGCIANFVCVESGTEYANSYGAWTCEFDAGNHGLGGKRYSATNRCGNKTNWLRLNGALVACMNPSGNRPHPGAFNELFIAAEWGSFC